MQKLIRRTAEAQRRAARRSESKRAAEYFDNWGRRKREMKQNTQEIASDLRNARVARRENWELGPAAPRRDLDGHMSFAATELTRFQPNTALRPHEIERRCAWAGGSKYLNLVVGDRVVIMEGSEKGKIDKISSIHMDSATVELETVGRHLAKVPDLYLRIDPGQSPTIASPSRIPISAIRLVHPLTDPQTGITRDVIVRQLTTGPVKWHRHTAWRAWTRYITGLNVAVPWPERAPTVREEHPSDTIRADVEEPTFVPSLLEPPLPGRLIDELRNRYSKFRTRHEEEYVLRKEQEEQERLAKRQEHLTMLTPIQELNRQKRELRRARGQPELSEEMLSKIGEVIARNKAQALNDAGLSEVLTSTGENVAPAHTLLETDATKESTLPPRQ